ncbi:hypothetical protein BC937DRAFT_94867 [Endogone sp. FLAS-F59071]|nr:hypothetical protein BC937DRAFT_94867 [Endogone sp. FLAS-F59071]|eukprot:RUS13732.1 hypothetical protein BC937DRAFT_94867 [Endogone sp. FLAS-F59071]
MAWHGDVTAVAHHMIHASFLQFHKTRLFLLSFTPVPMSANDEETVTAVDILEQQLELERDAREILPGKFEACSFSVGYVRQPVYACRTCASPDKDPSGICYSCSIACHGDHDVLELFAKRDFRCDCGVQGKFKGVACQLEMRMKEKEANTKNNYNHNYYGRFCWCNQNYDPETEETTMFQCVVCEDWFHDTCIGKLPPQDDFDEYICRTCTTTYPFLVVPYHSLFILGRSQPNEKVSDVVYPTNKGKKRDTSEMEAEGRDAAKRTRLNEEERDVDVVTEGSGEKDVVRQECRAGMYDGLRYFFAEYTRDGQVDLFLKEGWRSGLCTCGKCSKAFTDNHVEFLLQEEKTYEPEEDEDAGMSLHDGGLQQLQRMDRVQAIEGMMAYNKMAEQVKSFLQTFKETGKTVTKEDVEKFFQGQLRSCDRRKLIPVDEHLKDASVLAASLIF